MPANKPFPEPVLPPAGSGTSLGVLHLAAECHPFAQTGGLGEALANLAAGQVRAGLTTLVVMPLFRSVRAAAPHLDPAVPPFVVEVGSRVEEARLWRMPDRAGSPRVFFVEHPHFFDRPGIYGEDGTDYPDNHRRFAFLALATLAALPKIAPTPLVLHAHDWHAAAAPLLLRTRHGGDDEYDRIGCVLTIHNLAFQGHFPAASLPDIGLPWELYTPAGVEWYGRVNLLKGGIGFADAITTVSPRHAWEIQTPEGGFGLHDALQARKADLSGILNGIDPRAWDPRTDPAIAARFSADDLSGKALCKQDVAKLFGLDPRPEVPLFCSVGRLAHQKGIDVLLAALPALLELGQVAVLGSGGPRYADALSALARTAPGRLGLHLGYDEALEHKLMAGSDLFLMPSLYEPCGLTQMRAQRYGTVPVGRRVGGIADAIEDGVSGFLFDAHSAEGLLEACQRALARYRHPPAWQTTMRAGMTRDFGWERAVERYVELYHRVLARRGSDAR